MLQRRECPDLAQKALAADDGGERGPQHLDGDLAFVAQVERQIHGRHTTGANLAVDAVLAGERLAQRVSCAHAGEREMAGTTRAGRRQDESKVA